MLETIIAPFAGDGQSRGDHKLASGCDTAWRGTYRSIAEEYNHSMAQPTTAAQQARDCSTCKQGPSPPLNAKFVQVWDHVGKRPVRSNITVPFSTACVAENPVSMPSFLCPSPFEL